MSVFRVALNNTAQGLMDNTYETGHGVQAVPSIQRTVYIMGPNKINRELADGETFTDCNYYKRFCYPQVALSEAILTLVTDDGSVWSDVESENTYPLVYTLTCLSGTTYTDAANIADIAGDTGGYAVFCQITNTGANDVQVRLNGAATAIFTLEDGTSQAFNAGDLSVTKVEVSNSASGAATCVVEVLCSVKSVANS